MVETTLSENDFPALQQLDHTIALAASRTQAMLVAAKQIANATTQVGNSPEHIIAIAQVIATNFAALRH